MRDRVRIEFVLRHLALCSFGHREVPRVEKISIIHTWHASKSTEQDVVGGYIHAKTTLLRTPAAIAAYDLKSIFQYRMAELELKFAAVTASLVQLGRRVRIAWWNGAIRWWSLNHVGVRKSLRTVTVL